MFSNFQIHKILPNLKETKRLLKEPVQEGPHSIRSGDGISFPTGRECQPSPYGWAQPRHAIAWYCMLVGTRHFLPYGKEMPAQPIRLGPTRHAIPS